MFILFLSSCKCQSSAGYCVRKFCPHSLTLIAKGLLHTHFKMFGILHSVWKLKVCLCTICSVYTYMYIQWRQVELQQTKNPPTGHLCGRQGWLTLFQLTLFWSQLCSFCLSLFKLPELLSKLLFILVTSAFLLPPPAKNGCNFLLWMIGPLK